MSKTATAGLTRWPSVAWLAVVFGVLGVGYRLAVLLAELPPANSDEATSGLVTMHIVQGREFPLFFYGQYYMGALESYLAVPLFALFGSSTFALRLPNLLLYAVFLVLIWQLTRRLYSPWLAAVTVGLLALGSDRILKNQLIAGGGYPEMNPIGVLLVLLAVNLGFGVVRRRWLAFAGWGLVAGLTLWDDWLILPYVGAAGLMLLLVTGVRALRGRDGLALVGGLLVGLIPIVLHNLIAAPEHRSLAIYANLSGGADASWPDRLYGGLLFGLPMSGGLCAPSQCAPWQMWWGVAYPILLVAAGVLAVRGLRRASTAVSGAAGLPLSVSDAVGSRPAVSGVAGLPLSVSDAVGSRPAVSGVAGLPLSVSDAVGSRPAVSGVAGLPLSVSDAAGSPLSVAGTVGSASAATDERVRQAGRLALVVGAALTLLAYAVSGAAGATPVESSRYLHTLLISTPAVLWPLWAVAASGRGPNPVGGGRDASRRPALTRWAALVPLVALAVTMVVATGSMIAKAPELARVAEERRELVATLDRLGVNRFYSEYWTCNNLTFMTEERLVCAVIRDDLRVGWDRYLPYREQVRRAERPAYVLPAGTPLSGAVAGYLRDSAVPVTVTRVAGYDIYQPAGPVDLPLG
ncbi:ArnT family glycosyltransferase [Micromonospora polyrhachis]|uniref:Glycosyltransferase RgtA/B/C/D-like domain-containing protein n=1 Tax=Micromonospora polyrhachis TaxID=1282883 RepID=A0A7W7SNT1_9ACTN|nr:glycosyltransferase family 39 protein [Micromonospora polyrhachis]MBB4957627.1 hypothetical protein [Micromonospora polyrhachis]